MDADGQHQVNLTNSSDPESAPVWSPDCTRIVYSRLILSDGNHVDYEELFVMNADGSNQTRLTQELGMETGKGWSPDSKKIFYRASASHELLGQRILAVLDPLGLPWDAERCHRVSA